MTASTSKSKKVDDALVVPTIVPELLSTPAAPPPPLPDELAAPPAPGPTLAGAALSGPPSSASDTLDEPEAPPMTSEQIIGLVSEISAFGLPAGLAEAYKQDFRSNSVVALGVQMSGLADALASYGINSGGGKLPEWLSVALGVAVLGYGVYSTRGKYVEHLPDARRAAEEVGSGVNDFAGYAGPFQTADFGFSGAGEGSRGE